MQSLENHFLIAMPTMLDPSFKQSVTYICEHNDDGAMGLVINHPTDFTVGQLLDKVDIDNDKSTESSQSLVFAGGPVDTERGFVLHSTKYGFATSSALSEQIMITTSKDVLASLTTSQSPDSFLVTLGYAGWSAGQLESELQQNAWLTIQADPEIIFNTPAHLRWEKAIEMLGIDLAMLSHQVGHA